ncbi:DUF305 domain-containing protein [Herbidospora galbida]|uniref:DUF305 domain-containing protein n=1 Tax=Herbidospora galbida TaxID=2575442 RepID=A0A4U3MP86_9ACTN|nr:DUF305 domain-containing protein [Herbidospora galbida]TKK90542.1 DUF305 domain-containing protein [Herbidospora galbida]
MRLTTGAPWAVAFAALLVSGCAAPQVHGPAAAAVQPSAVTQPSAAFNPTDVAWIQLEIPMTESVLALTDLAPERTANPSVLALASQVAAEQQQQLAGLRGLLREAGLPPTNVHEGHDMPGMVTKSDLLIAQRLNAEPFDKLFRKHLKDFLTQSLLVAKGEQTSGANEATKQFAKTLSAARSTTLADLK